MKTVSVLLHECTAEEVANLPAGFPVIEYDSLYSSMRLIQAKVNRVRQDKRFVYLLYKIPPVNFVSGQNVTYGTLGTDVQSAEVQ